MNGEIPLVPKDLWECLLWFFSLLRKYSEKDRASFPAPLFRPLTDLVTCRTQATQTPLCSILENSKHLRAR